MKENPSCLQVFEKLTDDPKVETEVLRYVVDGILGVLKLDGKRFEVIVRPAEEEKSYELV